ncbi:hypothetical protein EBT31_22595, partial [bacterium]|nr:hypothetical protein [bacterium]
KLYYKDNGGSVQTLAVSPSMPQVISVNSSSDALRITQTGAGNALVVEDSTNPDSTPFVVNADGRVVVGYTAPIADALSTTSFIQEHATTGNGSSFSQTRWQSANTNGPLHFFQKSNSGTVGTHSIVSSGDTLGTHVFAGSDGTAFIPAAYVAAAVDGTPGTNDMPGRLVFSTTADGASSPTERMRIASTGAIGLSGANYGTSGQVLTSQGSGSPPVWAAASSSTSIGLVRAIAINCILP